MFFHALMKPSVRNNSTEGTLASVRRPSVCATGLPSLPRALGLGATLRCQAPPAPPSAALRSSHTPARPQWLYGAMWLLLRPSPRAYLVLRAFASLVWCLRLPLGKLRGAGVEGHRFASAGVDRTDFSREISHPHHQRR